MGRPHSEGITNTRALFLDAFNRLCGLRAHGPFDLAAQLWTFFLKKELALDIVPYLIRKEGSNRSKFDLEVLEPNPTPKKKYKKLNIKSKGRHRKKVYQILILYCILYYDKATIRIPTPPNLATYDAR